MSKLGIFSLPFPENEPVLNYGAGSPERLSLKAELERLSNEEFEIPLIIGGKEVKTGNLGKCIMPHDHGHVLAKYHMAGEKELNMAAEAALKAREEWANTSWEVRASIFKKMAVLLAGPYRDLINAATMLNQGKNAYQAEIDAAAELVDFYNFNTYYMQEIMEEQPPYSPQGMWNRLEQRPLEGFVFAVTPFNFTSIAGNLPTAPAMMGNVVLWKPASSAVYTPYFLMKMFKEAGLPDGVINFIPGSGGSVGRPVMDRAELAGIHFTGSTPVFHNMWKTIGDNIAKYHTYPRIVGETGGKDFIFVHPTGDMKAVEIALVRGSFEYQGQKCSAASRAYIPKSMWKNLKADLVATTKGLKMGDPKDFTNFVNAVIDQAAFNTIKTYIDHAKDANDAEIIAGGGTDDSKGYFMEPTIIETTNPHYKSMEEEIFGPVLTIYVYDDDKVDETLEILDKTSIYALTGAVFAQDRLAAEYCAQKLVNAAGNFYINDKPTGAVVGQQPFGGSRASGTNDKAGSKINLMRWVSPRTIKETYDPAKDYRYPFMEEE